MWHCKAKEPCWCVCVSLTYQIVWFVTKWISSRHLLKFDSSAYETWFWGSCVWLSNLEDRLLQLTSKLKGGILDQVFVSIFNWLVGILLTENRKPLFLPNFSLNPLLFHEVTSKSDTCGYFSVKFQTNFSVGDLFEIELLISWLRR